VLLALSWLLPVLLGFLALRATVDAATRARAGVLLSWASAVPLGVGLSSVVYFAAAWALGPSLWKTTAVELGVLAALALRPARARGDEDVLPLPRVPSGARWWLRASTCLALGGAAATFFLQAHELPFGDADGIGIWGNRAVFLHRAFGDWAVVFSPELVHTDYPLLLPLSTMRAFVHAGSETPVAGLALAFAFTACTYAALWACVARLRGEALACLATLGLCATPFFAAQGAGQTGDVPLACYTLLAAAWFRIGGAAALTVCGAFLGLAAWTKNEGGLVAAAFLFWTCVPHLRREGWRAAATTLARCLSGAAPALAALFAFKLWLAPANDLFANHDRSKLLPMLGDPERWRAVGTAFLDAATSLRGAGAPAGLGPLLLLAVALVWWRRPAGRFLDLELRTALSVAAAFFVVFLLSPYDLRWHLGTALGRLLLQVWPLCLLGVALALSPAGNPVAKAHERA